MLAKLYIMLCRLVNDMNRLYYHQHATFSYAQKAAIVAASHAF